MKQLSLSLIVACVVGLFAHTALAQEYRFGIDRAEVTVTLSPNGDAKIHYLLDFACDKMAHPIDVVDIGMPNMAAHEPIGAAMNGTPLPNSAIFISSYLEPRGCGYEVRLGEHTIHPGQSGRFQFVAVEHDMVWEDTTDDSQVSFRFTPTWFGNEYVSGTTELTVRVLLPIEMTDLLEVRDRIRWHGGLEEFKRVGIMGGESQVSVAFANKVRLTGPHMVGVSFPKKYMTHWKKDTIFSILTRWLEGNPNMRIGFSVAGFILFGFAFFLSTRGSGWSVFILLMAVGGFIFYKIVLAPLVFILIATVLLVLVFLRRRRFGKKNYLGAIASVEGVGIKRGLTAPLAALLVEAPFGKVLMMLLFGLMKKGVLKMESSSPLRFTVLAKHNLKGHTWSIAKKHLKLKRYERNLLGILNANAGIAVASIDCSDVIKELVETLVKDMHGYDLTQTQQYYRQKVEQAWKKVADEGHRELKQKQVDKEFDWLMATDNWLIRMSEFEAHHHHRIVPYWWSMRSTSTRAGNVMSEMTNANTLSTNTFSDVANSLAGQMESVSTGIASSLDGFGIAHMPSIDLSGADKFTKYTLSELFESSGSGSGGGGSSCACAGCACACACAGGGR